MDDYQKFIAISRYARWLDDAGRRETWEETVKLPVGQRERIHWLGSGKGKERSKFYPGIAEAMANQWG
jgi:hypothetical protein